MQASRCTLAGGSRASRLGKEIWVDAMSDKQAEDDLAETMFVVRLKLKELDAH